MKKYMLYAFALFGLIACGGDDIGENIIMSKEYINTISKLDFQGEAGEAVMSITANCDWTISIDSDWATVNPANGSQSQEVTVTVTSNNTGADRTATITVKGSDFLAKKITVTQAKSADSSLTPGPDDNLPPE